MLVDLLESKNLLQFVDFLYLPIDWYKSAKDWSKSVNHGYAFVNFISHEAAQKCEQILSGFQSWPVPSEKQLVVAWAEPERHGQQNNIDQWRNNPVMCLEVPPEYKPMLLKDGCPVPFPAPTKS